MNNYSFEKSSSNRLDTSTLQSNTEAFLGNLGATKDEIRDYKSNKVISEFLIQYCSNIVWYQKRQKKENNLRKLYNILSLTLLVIIPLGIFFITNQFADQNAELISSSIAAILTSVLAIHKTFATWMEKRKLNTLFHSASSRLKSRFYEIEEKWNDRLAFVQSENAISLKSEFLADLEMAVAYVRTVLDEEQLAYYELIAFPKIELSNLLKTSQADAESHLTKFQSSTFSKALKVAKLKTEKELESKELALDLQKWVVNRDLLEKKLELLEGRLAKAKKGQETESIQEEIKSVEQKIEDYIYEYISQK